MSNIARTFETIQEQFLYVGMDIHKDNHTAVAANCFGQNLLEMELSNSQNDFGNLVAAVERLSKQTQKQIIFGLEDSYGYGLRLARYLKEQGLRDHFKVGAKLV